MPSAAARQATGWKKTFVLAAIASLATAIFFWQLLDETSFFSAIRGVELQKLAVSRSEKGATNHPNWDDVYAELRTRLSSLPCVRAHAAVGQLLRFVIEVERGKKRAADVLNQAREAVNTDANNLISRLTYAVIIDRAAIDTDSSPLSPSRRFEAMRQVIEQEPGPTTATLYNQEFSDVWRDILNKYVKRADVAANLADYLDHFQITEHYAALPMIQQHFSKLSTALRADGRGSEADYSIRLIADATVGLMDASRDSGTRLLAAELLAKIQPPETSSGEQLKNLRFSFHALARNSPPDLTDLQRSPTAAPREQVRSFSSLVGAMAIEFAGLGAMIIACIAGIVGMFSRLHDGAGTERVSQDGVRSIGSDNPSLGDQAFGILSAAVVVSFGVVTNCNMGKLFSQNVILFIGAVALLFGMIVPIAISSRPMAFAQTSRARVISLIAILSTIALLPVLPPLTIALWMRAFFALPAALTILGVATALLIRISIVLAGSRLKSIRSIALKTWATYAVLAGVCLLVHKLADNSYISANARGRVDELATRNGPNWKERSELKSLPHLNVRATSAAAQ